MAYRIATLFSFIRKKVLYLAFCIVPLLLTGCASDEEIFYNSEKEVLNNMYDLNIEIQGNGLFREIEQIFALFLDGLKQFTPTVVLISIVIGIAGLALIKRDKKKRKAFIFTFIVGIPVFTVFLTYGVAFALSYFLKTN